MNEVLDLYPELLDRAKYKTKSIEDAKDIVQQSYMDYYSYTKEWLEPRKAIQMLVTRNILQFYKNKYLWRNVILKVEDIPRNTLEADLEMIDVVSKSFDINNGEFNIDSKYFKKLLKNYDADLIKAHHGMLDKPYSRLRVRTISCYQVNKKGERNEYQTLSKIRSRALHTES